MTRTRDQAIADSTVDPVDIVGRCRAEGCPNIWTTASSRLCHWHSEAEAYDWPRVTQELQFEVTQRAFELQNVSQVMAVSHAQKGRILSNLRTLFASGGEHENPKAWAQQLQDRDQAGEPLTSTQRAMYRSGLGRKVLNAARDGGDASERAIGDALELTGDLPRAPRPAT